MGDHFAPAGGRQQNSQTQHDNQPVGTCNFCGKKPGLSDNTRLKYEPECYACKKCIEQIKKIEEYPSAESLQVVETLRLNADNKGLLWIQNYIKLVQEEAAAEKRKLDEKKRAMSMPITSGQNFEGYRIVRYGGYVSGDEVVVLSDTMFSEGFSTDKVNDAIKKVRVKAIQELKEAAAVIGCNAVIGLDFDYVNIDRNFNGVFTGRSYNEAYIVLTANGTAVTIEPEV